MTPSRSSLTGCTSPLALTGGRRLASAPFSKRMRHGSSYDDADVSTLNFLAASGHCTTSTDPNLSACVVYFMERSAKTGSKKSHCWLHAALNKTSHMTRVSPRTIFWSMRCGLSAVTMRRPPYRGAWITKYSMTYSTRYQPMIRVSVNHSSMMTSALPHNTSDAANSSQVTHLRYLLTSPAAHTMQISCSRVKLMKSPSLRTRAVGYHSRTSTYDTITSAFT
mmetsp:Transcript_8132/g.28923  ORF Transcript_8132/g.28923 Transcript_8132/m.28923 type:complete len:222 (-) Transcript_8132:154-819(-)